MQKFIKNIKENPGLYIMVLPGVLFFIIFKYIPLTGSVMAFQKYSIVKGIFDSEWIGFDNFIKIFKYKDFWRVLFNTLRIGINVLVWQFPVSLVLALLINEIAVTSMKRVVQSLLYIPHFLSWVIVGGLVYQFLGLGGPINTIFSALGLKPVLFIQVSKYFDSIIILSGIWKDAGWGTIVYLATMATIDPGLYEAAFMDGANRFRCIRHVTIPHIIPTAIVLFLLQLGRFLDVGFDRVYQFVTPITSDVGDIIATYNYRIGILGGQYGMTAAIGIFQALIGFVMIWGFNRLANKVSDTGGIF